MKLLNSRRSLSVTVAVIIIASAMVLYAQFGSRVSPIVESRGQTFDEARLLDLALQHMRRIGLEGEIDYRETYIISLGQWFTLNDIASVIPEGFSRDMPVYVLKATGKFQVAAMPGIDSNRVEQDRVIIALLADSGQFLGHRSYGTGAQDLLIDVKRADDNRILIPSTLIPLDDGEPTPMPYPPLVPQQTPPDVIPLPLPAGP